MLPYSRLTVLAGLMAIVSVSGCYRPPTTSQPEAIAAIERLGGRLEPERPTPGKPVFRVSLSDTGVRDEHLKCLDAFPALRLLSLRNTDVSDAGIVHLKRLKNLKRVSLTGTQVTMNGMRDLRGALPQVHIQR